VHSATVVQAVAMFVATNIDDLVVLMVFFGRARLLPDTAVAYFGLVPLVLGLRVAWSTWRRRDQDDDDWEVGGRTGVGIPTVAAVTVANGGDNIGVYVPVFAVAGPSGIPAYVIVFLIAVGLWCALSQRIATRPAVAGVLERWEHVLLPVVLIGIGLAVLAEGGAFGL
jgi:cadmium resistance protein CadD (predicted permease)